MPTYFPEPTEPDATWGGDDEGNVEWLRRSTLPRAASIRAALNENLSHFEEAHARSLAKKLRADWKSHYFELLVGRCLQELGAYVEHEPIGTNRKRIDFRASWPELAVSVEAVSKRMNLHAVAGKAYRDNSEQRIRLAYLDREKRRQADGAEAKPAFLAVDGGTLGAHLGDFDLALLGGGVQHMGCDQETVGYTFRPATGEMLADTNSPWAGVLALSSPVSSKPRSQCCTCHPTTLEASRSRSSGFGTACSAPKTSRHPSQSLRAFDLPSLNSLLPRGTCCRGSNGW